MRRSSARAALVFFGVLTALAAPAAQKKQRSQPKDCVDAAPLIASAKDAMSQGNRKASIDWLDKAAQRCKGKPELKEIAAKRELFSQQFVTSESFQSYQGAKGFAAQERWDDCVHELDGVGDRDRDNVLVLRQRVECLVGLKLYSSADGALKQVLGLLPGDIQAALERAAIAVATKQTADGLAILDGVTAEQSSEVERAVILRAQLLEQNEQVDEAIAALKDDQDRHLDHVAVLYELGMLYTRVPSHDWPARKTLSAFTTRCKRMSESELKTRKFDVLLPQAQSMIAQLDKKLGI